MTLRIKVISNHNDSEVDVPHSHTANFYITTAIVAVLWANCKSANDYSLPNAAPHDPVSASETTKASKESIAESPSTELENETMDSQSVTSERTETPCQGEQEETAEPPLKLERCIQELEEEMQRFLAGEFYEEMDSQSVASERAETPCQGEQEETAKPPLKLEIWTKELEKEIQRFLAGEFYEE